MKPISPAIQEQCEKCGCLIEVERGRCTPHASDALVIKDGNDRLFEVVCAACGRVNVFKQVDALPSP